MVVGLDCWVGCGGFADLLVMWFSCLLVDGLVYGCLLHLGSDVGCCLFLVLVCGLLFVIVRRFVAWIGVCDVIWCSFWDFGFEFVCLVSAFVGLGFGWSYAWLICRLIGMI